MILLIDNYDSFSYNLFQLIGEIEPDIKVIRNDEMSVEEIQNLHPDGIIVSPGPGRPGDAGICIDVIQELGSEIPILGVCLGHQSICQAYGADITYAKKLMHGKQSIAAIDNQTDIFSGLPDSIPVARYHSLAADPDTIPDCLEVIAKTEDGEVMAVKHKTNPVYGVQFHPESIMTPDGKIILQNYIDICRNRKS